MDRCHQARVKNALEPEWEARFEPRSYGFRPGRSCQDAIEAIYDTCKGRGAARVWTLDADLAAAALVERSGRILTVRINNQTRAWFKGSWRWGRRAWLAGFGV